MSTLQLTLPQSMREQVEALAQKEGISIHEFIMLAVAEKLATLATADYLTERAKRGSREKLFAPCWRRRQMLSPKTMISCKCRAWVCTHQRSRDNGEWKMENGE